MILSTGRCIDLDDAASRTGSVFTCLTIESRVYATVLCSTDDSQLQNARQLKEDRAKRREERCVQGDARNFESRVRSRFQIRSSASAPRTSRGVTTPRSSTLMNGQAAVSVCCTRVLLANHSPFAAAPRRAVRSFPSSSPLHPPFAAARANRT